MSDGAETAPRVLCNPTEPIALLAPGEHIVGLVDTIDIDNSLIGDRDHEAMHQWVIVADGTPEHPNKQPRHKRHEARRKHGGRIQRGRR